MSFRRRLTLFFVVIVVIPMVALGAIVVELAGSSETGKADAALASSLDIALAVYDRDQAEAEAAARRAAADPRLAAAIRGGSRAETRTAVAQVRRDQRLASLAVLGENGERIARAGDPEAVAMVELNLEQDGRQSGALIASTTTATDFVSRVRKLTGRDAAVAADRGTVATTAPLGGVELPDAGSAQTVEIDGEEQRAASAELGVPGGGDLRLILLGEIESGGFAADRPLVAAALVAFFAIAFAFIVVLLRSLQSQIASMLSAARRIGSGDFSRRLPVEGNDEMAGLAREFNSMSDQLAAQIDELRRQRTEIDQSVRRIGEAFASGLDRTALLEIVAETANAACEAEHARILLAGSQDPEVAVGEPLTNRGLEAARAAERDALRSGAMADAREGDWHAISQPLATAGSTADEARDGRPSALAGAAMTIARRGQPFEASQREVLRYLIGQAAASLENVELHEMVAEQAITDELTGLPNNRRFRRWIDTETARAERFGHELSLLMLDIDDFKRVNDTHGHLQGDEVLRVIGRVLREESRGIDEPARYGGEEFAIGLPETDLAGAVEVAERVRERIAGTEIAMVDGDGSMRVTTSIGAAAVARAGTDARALVDAADQALYRAKRGGKNRTVPAEPSVDRGEGKSAPAAKIRGEG